MTVGKTTHGGTDAFVRPASEASSPAQTMPGGACPGWYINREPFLDVIRMHRASVNNINKNNVPTPLYESSKSTWDEALSHGEKHGYRNSQVTVLAPNRNHRFHDGLRYNWCRAGFGVGEV